MTWSLSEINRLGDRIRDGVLSDEDRAKLLEFRATFLPAYERVVADIRQALPDVKVTGRPEKTPDSIVAKLRRTKIELVRMQDIAGCRLVVDLMMHQDTVAAKLSALFPEARLIDRRTKPSFGYRAVHLVPIVDNRQVEIQVRSRLQHMWAVISERLADQVGTGLKYGEVPRGAERLNRILMRMSEMMATFETSGAATDMMSKYPKPQSAVHGAFMAMMALAMKETK